mmetsp:Transcript_61459/g.145340  ORF Transcript_61459/g.145340 Transcript_61459/m.145340 type:complete len:276 (-) Transcript_61459:1109-1936(-)
MSSNMPYSAFLNKVALVGFFRMECERGITPPKPPRDPPAAPGAAAGALRCRAWSEVDVVKTAGERTGAEKGTGRGRWVRIGHGSATGTPSRCSTATNEVFLEARLYLMAVATAKAWTDSAEGARNADGVAAAEGWWSTEVPSSMSRRRARAARRDTTLPATVSWGSTSSSTTRGPSGDMAVTVTRRGNGVSGRSSAYAMNRSPEKTGGTTAGHGRKDRIVASGLRWPRSDLGLGAAATAVSGTPQSTRTSVRAGCTASLSCLITLGCIRSPDMTN